MSSDSEPEDPRKIRASQGALKSLFASDRKAVENGPPTLKYDPRQTSMPSQAPLPGQPAQVVATQGMAVAFRGENSIGPCLVAVMVQTAANSAFVVVVNREKKPQCRGHWMLQFKSPSEALNFVVGALTVQHYLFLAEGQPPTVPHIDFVAPDESKYAIKAKQGDICHVGYKVWLVQRVGQTSLYTAGKVVEEVPQEAPKSITPGSGNAMLGIEESLRGATKGTRRIVFIPPRKTKSNGLGNPEIGAADAVVVVLTVNSVDKAQALDEFGLPNSGSEGSDSEDLVARKTTKRRSRNNKRAASDDDILAPAPKLLGAPQSTPTIASPVGLDTNALLQTVLLQSLQQQQKPAQPEPAATSAVSDVQRSVERLHYQIQSLYDKIDRIDFEKYLQTNNQVIERIVKKAVGKMPVNDVDVEDVTKDRNELLALIEQLKLKNQELTDNYHKALETLGKHKDETSSLKNDLLIEREASAQRFNELKERKRLELVDLEVKHRRETERVQLHQFEEGHKKGYAEGYSAGKIDAIEVSGSSSMSDMKQMLHKKDSENVELGSKLAQLESRLIQERREYKDQVDALNSLIARMEERRSAQTDDFVADVTAQTKRIRRVMNSVYASAEEQFYATEREEIPVADALAMLLVSVKTETRAVVDEIKNEAAIREKSDKVNRNDVVEAFTIASAQLKKDGYRQSKYDNADDVTGLDGENANEEEKPKTDVATDIDALRKELAALESRTQRADEYRTNNNPPPFETSNVAFEVRDGIGSEGEEGGFDFTSLPMMPNDVTERHQSIDAPAASQLYTDGFERGDEHLDVPEIPFE